MTKTIQMTEHMLYMRMFIYMLTFLSIIVSFP